MEQIGTGYICQQHAKGNRQQQQRLKLFNNGQIDEYAHDGEHN